MDILLNKAKINDSKLKSYITKTVAGNLSSLAEPCFYANVKKDFYEMLKICNLTEQDIKDFAKRRWSKRKEAKFATVTNHVANFYVFLLQYFLKKRDMQTYNYLMVFYIIRHYSALMHKHFSKFCNPDVFKYALETLTKTHLFIREKTISNALYYMSQEMTRRWTSALQKNDLDAISLFMQESRHRVSQSIKSFAQTYYKVSKEGAGLKTEEQPSDNEDDENAYQMQSSEKSTKVVDSLVHKIVVYRYSNRKAQEEARRISKINASLATQIVSKLGNTKHSDIIRLIYKLYLADLNNMNDLCGKTYEKYVRDLMSLKRTKQRIYFKQQINILLMDLLKEFGYAKKYTSSNSQTQFLINLFLAYYLTLLLKYNVCFNQ